MQTASLTPPRADGTRSRGVIPLWLALPASAAVAVVALAAAAVLVFTGQAPWPTPPERESTRDGIVPGRDDAGQREAPTALEGRHLAARDALEAGRHTEAFTALALLADEGHCESARLALQLIQAGPAAYLTAFRAEPQQVARWRTLASCRTRMAGR